MYIYIIYDVYVCIDFRLSFIDIFISLSLIFFHYLIYSRKYILPGKELNTHQLVNLLYAFQILNWQMCFILFHKYWGSCWKPGDGGKSV